MSQVTKRQFFNLCKRSKFKEAIALAHLLIPNETKKRSSASASLAEIWNKLSDCYMSLHQRKNAKAAQLKALKIANKVFNSNDWRLVAVNLNMGDIYMFCRKYKAAAKRYEIALSIAQKKKGRKSEAAKMAFMHLFGAWKMMGKTRPQIRRAIKAFWKKYPNK